MTVTFQLGDLVYNRNTKEDGAIKRAYEMNGVARYKVVVPHLSDTWAAGFDTWDWAGEVLQFSNNECLKS